MPGSIESSLISRLNEPPFARGLFIQPQRSRFAAPHAQRSELKASELAGGLGCTSISAQPFWRPVVRWGRRRLFRIVKDKDQRTASLSTGGREMHWRTARHYHVGSSCSPNHPALWSFQTRFAR